MKKLLPFLSLAVYALSMLNCTNRDENISLSADNHNFQTKESLRGDTLQTGDPIVDPDPPVKDGDNWRSVQKNKNK